MADPKWADFERWLESLTEDEFQELRSRVRARIEFDLSPAEICRATSDRAGGQSFQ